LAAAEAGLGVGLVPRFLAQDALDAGRVTEACPGVLRVPHGYYFSHPESGSRLETLKIFQAWLQAVAGGDSNS